MTMSPLVVGDKVIVGNSGGEFGVRGHMTAYDIDSGEMVWRGYSTGPDDEVLITENSTMLGEPIESDLGISTYPEGEWEIGGGTVWGWVTYDPELNLIYYGTGNPGTWNPAQRTIDGDRPTTSGRSPSSPATPIPARWPGSTRSCRSTSGTMTASTRTC
jgi:lanthanide-dependent methanol dehydrogenase